MSRMVPGVAISERSVASVVPAGVFLWVLGIWGAGVQLHEALASAGLAGCLVAAIADVWPRRGEWRAFARAWLPLWLFAGWALIAPLFAGRLPSGSGVARLVDWLALPAAAHALNRLEAPRQRRLLQLFAGVFLISCLAAGLQSYGIWPRWDEGGPSWLHEMTARVFEPAPGGRFMGGGLLFHRLKFAHIGGLSVLGAAAGWLRGTGKGRWSAAAVLVLGLYAVATFPFARGALLALALSLALLLLVAARSPWRALLAGATLLLGTALVVIASPPLRERFQGGLTADGNGDRVALWSTGLRAIAAHPVVGLGLGRFHPDAFSPPGQQLHPAAQTVKAHNQFLTVAAEGGLLGLALFLLLLVWIAREVQPQPSEGLWALGGLTFFVLLSLAHDPLFHAPFSMALVLVLAEGMGRARRSRSDG